jgi:gliding motility-associated-like protein
LTSATTVQPLQSGTYGVSVASLAGCLASASVDVVLFALPAPVVEVMGNSTVCAGESVLLQTGAWAAYTWMRNEVIIPGADSGTYISEQSGNYSVAVTDENGCTGVSAAVPVIVRAVLDPAIMASAQIACDGDEITLSVSSAFPVIQWSDGSNESSITATSSGTYSIVVVDEWGCEGSDAVDIHFHPMPVADAGDNMEGNCDGGVMIGHIAEGGSISWAPAEGLSDVVAAQPWARPDFTTTYVLTVENGPCKASDEVTVYADCFSFFAPNSFTPNGDGLNDVFAIMAEGIAEFRMVVADRWGNPVFISEDPGMVWNGNVQAGDYFAPDGVYNWRAVIRFRGRTDEEIFIGHVNILR